MSMAIGHWHRPLRLPQFTVTGAKAENIIRRLLTGLAAARLAIATAAAMSSTAQATAATYTPHCGPDVAFVGNDIAFTDVTAEQTFSCEQFDLNGTLISTGLSRPFGTMAATRDQFVYSGRTNPISGEPSFDQTGISELAIAGPEVGLVSPAKLTNAGFVLASAVARSTSPEKCPARLTTPLAPSPPQGRPKRSLTIQPGSFVLSSAS